MILVTADEMREMDRVTIEEVGIPGRILMEHAGRGAVDFFLERFPEAFERRIGILAGRGNNGGDGFVMARLLAHRGIPVTVFLFTDREKVKGDAAANLELVFRLEIPVVQVPNEAVFQKAKSRMKKVDIWIDALLGTGLKSDVKGLFKKVIAFVNAAEMPVFAVDIPSGLDSDTGRPRGESILARATATFGHAKIGCVVFPGAEYCGELKVVDIGIPTSVTARVGPKQYLLTPQRIRAFVRKRPPEAHKGNTGHVLVVAGSPGKTGAAAMTAMAAMRTGAGLVTLGIPESLNAAVELQALEAMTAPLPESKPGFLTDSALDAINALSAGKSVLALGPGIGTAEGTVNLVCELVRTSPMPMVIDADGLNCLARDMDALKRRKADTVLTPHPGEMGRLVKKTAAEIQGDRVGWARRLAEAYGVTVVLKGARTVTAAKDGTVCINPTGNPGMASGGMGDVLTGMIAGWMAQGLSPEEAAQAGVYLHGAAADSLFRGRGPFGYLASDVMALIPAQIRETTFL
ncbi:MAG: NAD(P)H-hydrate dehydratase [Deltaproteobacteria bacterium]|nr:NAD(P)H-hydrate dehydratase [Deltaproteobacteria bacterium]